jgi:MYXO-CTERM domain-containing protein
MMPRNSDATVPAGEGTADRIADWLDSDGACACRVSAAPSRGGERGVAAVALIAGLALARSARRKKG